MQSRERWVPVVLVAAYLATILYASRGLTNEDWDGVKAVNNALLVVHAGARGVPLDLQRPPLGWLLMAPWLGAAYRLGGAWAALRLAHRLWPLYLGALLLATHAWLRRFVAPGAAAAAALLMAFNPIVIQFAPFALMDVFAGLAVLAFLAASRRWLERPDRRNLGWLAAAYAAAFLSKYHLGLLILIPLAYRLLESKARSLSWAARLRRFAWTPLWLFPPACWALGALFLALVGTWVYSGAHPAFREAWSELGADFSFNLLTPKQSRWHLYAFALRDELGPGLFLLAGWGVWRWLREDGDGGLFLALSLALPYAALAFAIGNKEARYAIPFLPLVYAAAARGIESGLALLPPGKVWRGAALAGCLALAPWESCLASARYLSGEPSVHTPAPWALAELLAREPGACVSWKAGDLSFRIHDPLFRYEKTLIVGAPTFQFFSRNRVVEFTEAAGCPWLVEPRDGPDGPRWEGPELGRVYADGGKSRWAILESGVVARP